MKLKLELSKFQIHFIARQLELFDTGLQQMNFNIQPNEKKLVLSICSDISDKFHNKSRSISNETKPKKKPYEITLKWHQCYALNTLIFSATIGSRDREDIAIGQAIQMIIGAKL
jgi:hypothetical protein